MKTEFYSFLCKAKFCKLSFSFMSVLLVKHISSSFEKPLWQNQICETQFNILLEESKFFLVHEWKENFMNRQKSKLWIARGTWIQMHTGRAWILMRWWPAVEQWYVNKQIKV